MSRYKWVIIAVFCAGVVAQVVISIVSMVDSVPAVADINALPTIVIDPGHGGIDGGAVGIGGLVEKNINLEISLMLRDILQVNGFHVVMTRETDTSIHDEGITGTRKQKVSDMHNRLDFTKQYPGCIFISIHQNKFGDSRSNGTQVFYSPNHPGSEQLAELMQRTVVEELQPNNKREKKKAGKNLYLMTNAECPAVLLECGFLSNSEEARKLTDPEYQAKIAFVTFESVMRYLELEAPGSGEPANRAPGQV